MVLTLSAVSKSFSGNPVLNGIDFSAGRGEIVAIVGRSGTGKSTLLNIVARLLAPDSGTVTVDGVETEKARHRFTFMQQTPQLLPYRTALQNACLALELRGELTATSIAYTKKLLAEFGLGNFTDYYPDQLSGGMQQKVAFARTIAVSADIVLCDEPFSALDFEIRLELESLFRRQIMGQGKLALLVTHDIDAAISVADRILLLGGTPAMIKSQIDIARAPETKGHVLERDSDEFRGYASELWHGWKYDFPLPVGEVDRAEAKADKRSGEGL